MEDVCGLAVGEVVWSIENFAVFGGLEVALVEDMDALFIVGNRHDAMVPQSTQLVRERCDVVEAV